jgi:hypothetical protein
VFRSKTLPARWGKVGLALMFFAVLATVVYFVTDVTSKYSNYPHARACTHPGHAPALDPARCCPDPTDNRALCWWDRGAPATSRNALHRPAVTPPAD